GAVQQTVEPQVAVVAGEAERHPVAPGDAPEGGEAFELFAEEHPAHTASRSSISGTDGASPAAKAAALMSSRSSAKRTGTSNRKPARTSAPTAGASAKTTRPPGSSVHPVSSIPSTLTTSVPARGRVIRRSCGSGPEP